MTDPDQQTELDHEWLLKLRVAVAPRFIQRCVLVHHGERSPVGLVLKPYGHMQNEPSQPLHGFRAPMAFAGHFMGYDELGHPPSRSQRPAPSRAAAMTPTATTPTLAAPTRPTSPTTATATEARRGTQKARTPEARLLGFFFVHYALRLTLLPSRYRSCGRAQLPLSSSRAVCLSAPG